VGIRTDFFVARDDRAVRDADLCESLPRDHFDTLELGGVTIDTLDAIATHLQGRAPHPEDPSALEILSCGPNGPWINRVSDSFGELLLASPPAKIREAVAEWWKDWNKSLRLKPTKAWTEDNLRSMTAAMGEIAGYVRKARAAKCPLYMLVSL
jgi:hypothetical protein